MQPPIDVRREAKGITYDETTGLYWGRGGFPYCSESCTNRARIVTYYVQQDVPKRGPSRKASNGKYVTIGWGKCGNHNRGYRLDQKRVDAALITKDPEFNADTVLAYYEKSLADERERREQFQREYMDDLIRTAQMTADDFTVKVEDISGGKRWVIYGPTGYGELAPVSLVEVSNDTGIYRVVTSDYSGHVGRGRGNTALTRLIARLMVEAADKVDEMNAGIGLDIPVLAEEV